MKWWPRNSIYAPWNRPAAAIGERPVPQPWLGPWLKRIFSDIRVEYLCIPLSLLAVAHLAAVAVFPGGYNAVFDTRAASVFSYATYFPAADVLGFPSDGESRNFLLYKIYGQNGEMLEGTLPDTRVRPHLRYERWAEAGDVASARNLADLHASILAYLVTQLPEPPLRIEMFSARWVWDHNKFIFPWRGFNRDNALELHLLGTYHGLTQVWRPAGKGADK
jgi:hypothetical protein